MKKEERLVKKLYSEMSEIEWKRLVKDPFHRLEFDTTMRFLKKYLPKKGLVFDAGGGPGRYTIELAKKGYKTILLDFVPENLKLAEKQIKKAKVQKKVEEIVEGSITNLSQFQSNSFDAVICLGGPLSHIHPEKNRKKAVSELIRVAKKGAPIFVSVMGRLAVIMNSPSGWPQEIAMTKHFEKYSNKGDDYQWHGGKSFCHFFTKDELRNLFNKKNIKILEMIGLEGLASPNRIAINELPKKFPKGWNNWLKIHYKFCTHPSVVDISEHMMIIVRKK